jgi:uncharacterized membrane protein
MGPSPSVVGALQGAAEWLRLVLGAAGGLAIVYGIFASITHMVQAAMRHERPLSAGARLELARYLALALEFQLAADVVETSVSPDWTTISRLAAIAAIRTVLNLFLSRDMAEDRRLITASGQDGHAMDEVASR